MKEKTIGNCLLYHGDCFDILPKLDVQADAVISDPPFGITDCDWDILLPFARFWDMIACRSKPTANFVLFGCGKFTVDLINAKYLWYRYDLVWAKNNKVGFLLANKMPMRNHESVLLFGRPGYQESATYNPQKTPGGRVFTDKKRVRSGGVYPASTYTSESDGTFHPCTVLSFDHDRQNNQKALNLHPTQKPLALMEWLVKSYTNEEDTVIDPFMGSGTTGVACAMHNRRFIGIEQNEEYFETAVKRIYET